MSETLIFEDDIGTAYVELLSCYAVAISPPPFSLTIGEKYKVVWDGQSYDVEAVDGSAVGSEVVMGNGAPFGLDGNDEPFAVVYTSNAGVIFAALTDTASTAHTVAVYHVTEDEPSVDPDDATVVLAEQTLTFNGTDQLIIELSSPLVVGQTYRVMWNGTAYTSTAADLAGVVFIGNAAFSGLDGASDTGEPFAIAYFDGECAIFTLDAGDHTVAIYQEVEDVHASNDAVILSYSQNPVEYKAVPKVWLTHPDSTEEAPVLVPFTYGELLEGVEIMPDFAEGDMQISVPDGSLVKEATIIKPEDLTPENIRKGVTIGGIEGEFLGDTGAEAEEVTVDLDFSEGDMVIAPEEDKVFSTVKIPKPDTLTPENIAKGVEIAGIVGTLAVSNAAIEIYQKQLDMSLSSASSKQSTALLLAASDLPEWWPAAGSMVAHSYGSYNPIYIVLLVRISGRGGQYYLQSAMISNFTGSPSYPAMAGYLVAKSNGYNGFNGVNSRYWNYTTPSGYNGLFQNTSGICLGSYNQFCQCSGTYKLILLKINPYA